MKKELLSKKEVEPEDLEDLQSIPMAKSVKACARVNQMCVWNINQYRLGFCGQKHCQLERKGSETGRLSLYGTGQDEGAIGL